MRLLIAALLSLVPVACSSTTSSATNGGNGPGAGSSSAGNAAAATPSEKCAALASAYCQHAKACQVTNDVAGCAAQVEDGIHCSEATGVTSTYDACLRDLASADCKAALPSTCQGVVLSPASSQDAGPATAAPPASSGGSSTKPYAIWGRPGGTGDFNVYLGCLCAASEPDSVTNSAGLYGPNSKFSTDSIWNQFGTYGGDFSNQSVCNKFGSDAPIVVDNGVVVGRLTVNQFAPGAITDSNVQAFLTNQVCAR